MKLMNFCTLFFFSGFQLYMYGMYLINPLKTAHTALSEYWINLSLLIKTTLEMWRVGEHVFFFFLLKQWCYVKEVRHWEISKLKRKYYYRNIRRLKMIYSMLLKYPIWAPYAWIATSLQCEMKGMNMWLCCRGKEAIIPIMVTSAHLYWWLCSLFYSSWEYSIDRVARCQVLLEDEINVSQNLPPRQSEVLWKFPGRRLHWFWCW